MTLPPLRAQSALRRTVAHVAPERSRPGVRVLLYHSIDDPQSSDSLSLRVPQRQFLEQMTLLKRESYVVVPLHAVSDSQHDDGRVRVAVTFDDGYKSLKWAADVLHEFGFPATFFLVPRFLEGTYSPRAYWEEWEHLDWSEAAVLIQKGFEVGAHSMTHPDLKECPDSQLETEVSGAKASLGEHLDTEIASFSYPHGRHDKRVRMSVAGAGYRLACTSRYGLNRDSQPLYRIRRTEIAGTDTLRDFQWKLAGKYDWLGYWQDLRLG